MYSTYVLNIGKFIIFFIRLLSDSTTISLLYEIKLIPYLGRQAIILR